MGYFRMFYYISYIFNTICRIIKRHGKAVLWLILIVLFLFVCMYSPKSHAMYVGNDTYTDAQQNVLNAYNGVVLDFVRRFANYRQGHENDAYVQDFLSLIENNNSRAFYIYYGDADGLSMVNSQPFEQFYVYVLVYQPSAQMNMTLSNIYSDYLGNFCDIWKMTPANKAALYKVFRIGQGTFASFSHDPNGDIFYMPTILYNYYNDYFVNYFYNNYSIEQIELLAEMDQKLGQVTNTVQDTQNYLEEQPSSNDFSNSDLPSDSGITDTTTDGLNNIFTKVYNKMTANPGLSDYIKITIPYTNKFFYIYPDMLSSAISGTAFNWLTTIIAAFWWYVVARIIVKDLVSKFEGIQSGNIENIENNNIKEDLL